MTRPKLRSSQISRFGALTVDQLEEGLLALDEGAVDTKTFWDQNVTAFRQTLYCAIRETSEALLSQTLPLRLRVQLEAQLETMNQHVEVADRYIEGRSKLRGRLDRTLGLPGLDSVRLTIIKQCRGVPCDNQLFVRRKNPNGKLG